MIRGFLEIGIIVISVPQCGVITQVRRPNRATEAQYQRRQTQSHK
jgi:hypothetical protein